MKYKGEHNNECIPMRDIQTDYPLLYGYLTSHKAQIREKVKCRSDEELWHTFTREHNHGLYFANKIIVPMTAKDTIATYVKGRGLYMDNSNVWFITIANAPDIIMKSITCIINSAVFSVLAKAGANPQSGGYFKFNRQFLDFVPFPSVNFSEDDYRIIRLEQLHDEITKLQNQWLSCIPAHKELLSDALSTKWLELDNICADLYELTIEERQYINSFGRTVSRIALLNGVN